MTIAEIYEEYERALRRYALSLVRDPDRADDLVQQTFVRAITHLDLVEGFDRQRLCAWLRRVLKNLFLDGQRRLRRQEILIEKLADGAVYAVDPSSDIGLQDLTARAPVRYRQILVKRYVLGWSSAEIARDSGVPAATIRSRPEPGSRTVPRHAFSRP